MKLDLLLSEIITATGGKCLSDKYDSFISVGTDTRKPLNNQLFVALKGDVYDAHNYLEEAVSAGATGLLVHRLEEKFSALKGKITIILVNDTLIALQKLGQFRREQWNKPIIAITGSNGKTTTKEFTAQILSNYKKVHYNQGSFNNHWGLPLTLLGLMPDHEVAICEMGMNHPGEIKTLVEIAEPNIVGVTMVGRAHLEGLGSIAAVAAAKEEIYNTPNKQLSIGLFNLDNDWTKSMQGRFTQDPTKSISFSSIDSTADVYFNIVSIDFDHIKLSGSIHGIKGQTSVPVFGKQNLTNLMFAASAALAVGLSPDQIWSALPSCKTTWGRNQRITHPQGADFLFDGYNANPDSQKALIENLKLIKLSRPLVGIFGEMRELGSHSEKLHEELGELASSVNFSEVIFIGNYGDEFRKGFSRSSGQSKATLYTYKDVDCQAIQQIKTLLSSKPLITIKGSRGVRLERILKELSLM